MNAGAPAASSADVTTLLLRWSGGEAGALDALMNLIYEDCRRLAARQLRRERPGHSLDPTSLVHELYLRLVDQRRATWENRAQFFSIAARLMRRILVDHARHRSRTKRGGGATLVSLSAANDEPNVPRAADVLRIDDALQRLGHIDEDQVRIVELRFFAGLTIEETALAVGRSPRTVKREWRLAKAWLFRELRNDEDAESF
jgi:RNA polymerase sigma factor (TIGR02999 family)